MKEKVAIDKEKIREIYTRGSANSRWLIEHYEELIKNYNNSFVAVNEGKVIDYDVDPSRLLQRLKEKGIDISTVAIDFVTDNPALYIL